MSIKSTHIVTKEDAVAIIQSKLLTLNDEQLSDVLETVIHNGFYNFAIVDKQEFDNNLNNENHRPYIDLYNIPEYNDAY